MRIPIGVVEIILRMVEEKHLAEHKVKFQNTLDLFTTMRDQFQDGLQLNQELWFETEFTDDISDHIPSFISYCIRNH